MLSRFVLLLHERQPRLKTEWVRRLCAEPVSSAMAEPAILAHLMDETLGQYYSLLQQKADARWLRRHPPKAAAAGGCRCGLNPLLAYFVTGQQAVDTVLDGLAGSEERARLTLCWHFLAQREIDVLCTSCVRNCPMDNVKQRTAGSGSLQPADAPAIADAGGPGKQLAPHPQCGGRRG